MSSKFPQGMQIFILFCVPLCSKFSTAIVKATCAETYVASAGEEARLVRLTQSVDDAYSRDQTGNAENLRRFVKTIFASPNEYTQSVKDRRLIENLNSRIVNANEDSTRRQYVIRRPQASDSTARAELSISL